MAGLGFKDFQVGEVLTSSDVDGYLMQQTVMRFADAGSRGSALGTAPGTAVALAEGMVSYLVDTDAVEVYNGSEWVSVGLKQSAATLGTATIVTATTYTDVGLSVAYTPSDAANILVVEASGWVTVDQVSGQVRDVFGLMRLYDTTSSTAVTGAEEVKVGVDHPDDQPTSGSYHSFLLRGRVAAGSTSTRTYRLELKANTNQRITLEAATATAIITVSEIAP